MIKVEHFYFGVVESINDPLEMGRLAVRIFGIHTDNKQLLPTDKLPWCDVCMPMPEPFISGIGQSPTGMVNGAMVMLLPKDSFLQEWFVMFSIGGMRKNAKGVQFGFNDPEGVYPKNTTNHDVNILARGKTSPPGLLVVDNQSPYGAAADKVANRTTTEVDPNAKAPEPIKPEDVKDAPWMKFALGELGTNERDNPDKVKDFHTHGGGSSSWGGETPWCASYSNWCFYKASLKGSGSAMARSFLNWGKDLGIEGICYGAVIVIKGNRGPSSGHVCFATGVKDGRVQVIGGNQGNKNDQNGGEVTKSSFPLSSVIGVRWPS